MDFSVSLLSKYFSICSTISSEDISTLFNKVSAIERDSGIKGRKCSKLAFHN